MEKIYIDWNDVEQYLKAVQKDIEERGLKVSGVYGLPRGGLILAALLSYQMDIPLLTHAAKDCIVIDDIADTGRSLYHFRDNRSLFNRYYITTMYYVEDSLVKPDFYVREKHVGDWVVYPWERLEENN